MRAAKTMVVGAVATPKVGTAAGPGSGTEFKFGVGAGEASEPTEKAPDGKLMDTDTDTEAVLLDTKVVAGEAGDGGAIAEKNEKGAEVSDGIHAAEEEEEAKTEILIANSVGSLLAIKVCTDHGVAPALTAEVMDRCLASLRPQHPENEGTYAKLREAFADLKSQICASA